ncbi:Mechanosensitive ion channel MscS [Dillenia turbinata]|uniref:Mechanosensitive ion channel protein n=1 Tax=Dillenia turbinata TaxID=194707 RepID=A0AAN8WF25_9MAGN
MESTKKPLTEDGGSSNDVVLLISSHEQLTSETKIESKESNSAKLDSLRSRVQSNPLIMSSPTSEITKSSPSANKPPKIPTSDSASRQKSLVSLRSVYSKPKSRLVEPSYAASNVSDENINIQLLNSPNKALPINKSNPTTPKATPITPKTPLMASPGGEEVDDEEVYRSANLQVSEATGKKLKIRHLIEWILFVCLMGLLISSLTFHMLLNTLIWGLQLWRWSVLVLVIFCGRLFSEWFINVLVFLIERNFLLKKKVLYFVYGLKRSVQIVIWLGLILLAWGLLFNNGVHRSKETTKVLNYITRGLASCLFGAVLWLLKTLFVKLLASSFHVQRFFDRIQESIFHQYVLQTLSGPPLMEMAESVGSSRSGRLSFKDPKKGKTGKEEDVIDVDKLHKMKPEKISAWTMRELVKVIRSSGLSTLSNALYQSTDDDGNEQKEEEITSEMEAKAAAYRIFVNVAKPGHKYLDEEDLLRFMKKEEVDNLLPLFEGAAETKQIKKSALRNWVVKVYLERKSLAHSLDDTKTAIEELNKIVSAIVLVIIIIVWLLLMGFATTQVLVFISSQLLLVAFMFGNTCKTVFEAIIFVFVMHPFDVGDRCVIDGIQVSSFASIAYLTVLSKFPAIHFSVLFQLLQMIVEEMNILTTVFLRYDNEKIFYPNAVLATKPISNFYRSPEMSDSVEFCVDFSTSVETIAALKTKIKAYIDSKPKHWRPNHSIIVKEIVDVNKIQMGLYVNHTINFQNYGDKSSRRSELVLELKRIFEELNIKYNLLPQEVHFSYVGSANFPIQTQR